jgi:hypothetical protein
MKEMKTTKREFICRSMVLTVLTVLLPALTSCDGLGEGTENGTKTAVAFSVGNIAPWSAETLVRSASETPRIVETASVPLGDNWVLEASWVEDPAAPTRATEPLKTGAIVRIIANNGSDVVAESNYEYQSDGSLLPAGLPMTLTAGTYNFSAYSYNSSTATLPTTSATDPVIFNPYVGATDTGNDLIWSPSKSVTLDESATGIELNTFTHKFSKVKYSVEFNPAASPTYSISVKLSTNYQAQLTKSNYAFAPSGLTTEQLLDKDNYRIVYAGDSPPVLKISGTISSKSFTDVSVPYKQSLAAGKSYTLQITITNRLTWAGSNIYWDGTRLTFAAPDTDDKQYYQGVFFRWGSLVGISPVQTNGSPYFAAGTNGDLATGTPIYVPPVPGGPANWTQTNLTTAQSATYSSYFSTYHTPYSYEFDKIPYVNNNDGDLGATGPTYNPAAFKGDICRYLTGQPGIPDGTWVMPTLVDFESASRSNWTGSVPNSTYWYRQPQSGGFTENDAQTAGYPDGTYGKESGHWRWGASYCGTTTVLPASGYRNYDDGALGNTGNGGGYWSSSVDGASNAYDLGFYSSGVNTYSDTRGWGASVRCVLQHY